MFSFFQTQKTQKIIALVLLAVILIAIPITVWFGQQQQQTQQKAEVLIKRIQHYACGKYLVVELGEPTETPSCTNNATITGLSSYQTSVTIRAQAGSQGAYQVKWAWAQFFCPTDPGGPCLQNGTLTSGQGGLTGDNKAFVTATSDVKTPSDEFKGKACGYYQHDFGFQVFDNNAPTVQLCGVSLDIASLGNTNNNATWCHSDVACTPDTPTTPVTPTDTITPTTPVTPTDTPTPTVTTTPGPSDTPTPTNNPSVTPTPTMPVVATSTPKPTLPPTGPGNMIIGVGLVGAVAAVIGTIVILAL